jgi:hypothetical protein
MIVPIVVSESAVVLKTVYNGLELKPERRLLLQNAKPTVLGTGQSVRKFLVRQ